MPPFRPESPASDSPVAGRRETSRSRGRGGNTPFPVSHPCQRPSRKVPKARIGSRETVGPSGAGLRPQESSLEDPVRVARARRPTMKGKSTSITGRSARRWDARRIPRTLPDRRSKQAPIPPGPRAHGTADGWRNPGGRWLLDSGWFLGNKLTVRATNVV